ncbi:hypothetical protein SETIT_5G092500v2 [Setaria italica]|uniref:Protein kinase domain-containing protein n=2 Tax=Setaria italica TaxID=4555 RepID=A0A368R2Z9_SETIT|nr:rust resistance kinase Lr10 [Setaria italica]RCV24532.1 hypothetical protein SETIT_5G092500v2 [Setaria italica]
MKTSPVSVSLGVFLFILLPTFSSSSCLSTLKCNNTDPIEIRPPFFVGTPDFDPACRKSVNVSCGQLGPELDLATESKLLLNQIHYDYRTVVVQDVELSVLKNLSCSFMFTFRPPVANFQSSYPDLVRWFSSISCGHNNLTVFHSIFGDDKDVDQNTEPDERGLASCHASPRFEWILNFSGDGKAGQIPQFSVRSGSIRKYLLSPSDCVSPSPGDGGHGEKYGIRLLMAVFISATSGMLLACFFAVLKPLWKKLFLFRRKNRETKENIELILSRYGITPKRYRYTDLKRITRSFSEKLGEGGYGMVFKGALKDGRLVAVKLLHNSRGDGEEFVNEVVSIVNASHVNIVCLLGFCIEGSRRGLIYEYMPNGSLERYIYSENPKSTIGWEKLYDIAIGIARGLEYLHRGCNRRIIHFDVKPHNILLDENYYPRIADFGLAKLCNIKESIVSMAGARGTIGFIAPEVFSRSFGVVSTKSDIYSFGMVILEMVGGRRNVQTNPENSSQIYFPEWLHDHLSNGGTLETFDVTSATEEIATKMALIGLWCIQMMPEARPSITKVIDMLERSVTELEIPPMQFLSCPPESSIHSINTDSGEDTQNLSFLTHFNK